MKLTKKVRLSIYRKALEFFKNGKQNTGLCYSLGYAILDFYPYTVINLDFVKKLPEILKHKPADKDITIYWWDINDRKIRIQVLETAIKELS
ncbi:MAG: hypothetical protein WC389_14980 [Lutibacter sp.]|jgi:hypothetical protein